MITVKLDITLPRTYQKTSKIEVTGRKNDEHDHGARLQDWVDETYKQGPWNAVLDARTGNS